MKVFRATTLTQGQRKNDFSFTDTGELIAFGTECDRGDVDDACGCRRAVVGLKSRKGTTTFIVDDAPSMTLELLTRQVYDSNRRAGFNRGMVATSARIAALAEAKDLAELASRFPAGTILEKRGALIQAREPKKAG